MKISNPKLWKLIPVLAAAGLLIFLILSVNFLSLGHYLSATNAREYMFSKFSFIGTFVSEVKKNKNLITENLALKEENRKLLSQLAVQTELKDQVDFLRQALNMQQLTDYKPVDAGTYNLQFTPEGHYLLVNKGLGNGIKNGDIVVSPSGVLVGQISDTNDDFSRVRAITDPNLKVTVKLLNKNISAIAKGMLDNGLYLDYISQNDEAAENDIIITSGNDLFPAGLIVGTISKIDLNAGSLFKKVEARAEFKNINISRVLILTR